MLTFLRVSFQWVCFFNTDLLDMIYVNYENGEWKRQRKMVERGRKIYNGGSNKWCTCQVSSKLKTLPNFFKTKIEFNEDKF